MVTCKSRVVLVPDPAKVLMYLTRVYSWRVDRKNKGLSFVQSKAKVETAQEAGQVTAPANPAFAIADLGRWADVYDDDADNLFGIVPTAISGRPGIRESGGVECGRSRPPQP